MKREIAKAVLLTAAMIGGSYTLAAVGPADAERLKADLTPLGAERAGNSDGSIPEWKGGYTKVPDGWKSSDKLFDLFPSEKPIFEITAQNYQQYKDKLNEGTIALLQKYPETFRLQVYPSHRTMAASAWVYDNTYKNALNAKLVGDGLNIDGAYGGIPFPIPKNGIEAMWNHTLRVHAPAVEYNVRSFVGSANGKRAVAVENIQDVAYPYYYPNGSAESWNKRYLVSRMLQVAPPFKAGESLIITDFAKDTDNREAWQYLVGQRRVRKAPNVGYDTPDFVASGAAYFDEPIGFFGHLDRYDWKLVGKREMYIPYNNHRFFQTTADDAFDKFHLRSDKLRWELHRVWVVEATVKQSKRHAVPKRTLYLDEDSWGVALMDGYDAKNRLWRTMQNVSFLVPSVPMMVAQPTMVFNLDAGTYVATQFFNDKFTYKVVEPKPDSYFSPDALAGEGIR